MAWTIWQCPNWARRAWRASSIPWCSGATSPPRAAPGCGASLQANPFADVPALGALLEEGWVYVASDYAGLTTKGPHPYLIGDGEARSVLDAARAAHDMTELTLSLDTVIWGHSQGGHAALWSGILARSYAPELQVKGIHYPVKVYEVNAGAGI